MRSPRPVELALLLLTVTFLVHLQIHWAWLVEDAAISFAFARNWAAGDGLVAWPGGERVEGYSNFLWVALVAVGERLGLHAFDVGRVLGAVFGAGCLPLSWAIARRLPGVGAWTALAAPALLAASAQHTIWAGSGMEPPLVSFLLALGIWRTLVEAERGGPPLAALPFLGLALTRPEGIAYAAIGGGWALLLEARSGRGPREGARRIGLWLLIFWGPFLAYHAVRFGYFAFEFPATYYAKLGDRSPKMFSPRAPGWAYVRDFFAYNGHRWFLPVYVVGLTGVNIRNPALWIGLAGSAGFWAADFLGMPILRLRIVMALGLLLPAIALTWSLRHREPGWEVRGLCWALVVFSVFFAVLAQGDWMFGHRWMAHLVVPAALLFTSGVAALAATAERLAPASASGVLGPLLMAGLVGSMSAINVSRSVRYDHCCSPWTFKERLDRYTTIKQRLALDEMVILDADMGAMTWWGPRVATDIYDKLGLVDMPFALHLHAPWRHRFVEEYALQERPFDVTFWDDRFPDPLDKRHPAFRRAYVPVPLGFVPRRPVVERIYVARRLVLATADDAPTVSFGGDVSIGGIHLPAPVTAPDEILLVEARIDLDRAGPQITGFLAGPGGARVTWDMEPAYGLLPPHKWRDDEVFAGRFQVPMPRRAPPGTYDIGFRVRDRRARRALQPLPWPEGAAPADNARIVDGELRLVDAIQVVSPERYMAMCAADVARVHDLADAGDCDAAQEAWETARLRRLSGVRWTAQRRAEVAPSLAECLATQARSAESLEEQVSLLEQARRWDRHAPTLAEVGPAVADVAWARGVEARDAGDADEAYRWFRATLGADPTRAWARRYAEQARVVRMSR